MSDDDWKLAAELAMELISSAFGRGMDDAGPDDSRITMEAAAVNALKEGDTVAAREALEWLRKVHSDEWADLERQYGPRR